MIYVLEARLAESRERIQFLERCLNYKADYPAAEAAEAGK